MLCFPGGLIWPGPCPIKQTNNRLFEMFALFEIIWFDPDQFSNNQTIFQVQKLIVVPWLRI